MTEATENKTNDDVDGQVEHVVRRPAGLDEIKDLREPVRIERAVQTMTEYMATYKKQPGYMGYRMQTFIGDVLYGLGLAIDPSEYSAADGFDKFKEALKKYLDAYRSP